jgi:hypothetical protein
MKDISSGSRSLEELVEKTRGTVETFDPLLIKNMKAELEGYAKDIGAKPYLLVNREYAKLWSDFHGSLPNAMAEFGTIPVQYAALECLSNSSWTPKMRDVIGGKHDYQIARYAPAAPGILVSSMEVSS